MKGVFEGDDRGALGVGADDLHGVFDGFSAAVHEKSLLRELAGSDLIHSLGEFDVAFVRRDLHAGVEELVELAADGFDHGLLAMAGVSAADAAGEIDVTVAVDVFKPRVFGFGNVDGRAVRQAAGHGLNAAFGKRFGLGAGDRRT